MASGVRSNSHWWYREVAATDAGGQVPHKGPRRDPEQRPRQMTPRFRYALCCVCRCWHVRSSDQRCHAHCRHEAACATELESNSIARPYALATRRPEHRQTLRCTSTRVSATVQEARAGIVRPPNWRTSLICGLGLGVNVACATAPSR